MQFGLFDHVELADRPLAQTLDERLEFATAADERGFYALHVAEHHCTPLNMTPVPGVYLGAVARQTKTLRLGPLVYLLPLYSPLRLAEEIALLDHLSKGRMEIGVGRGVSPFELGYHRIAHEQSRDIFLDAYACLTAAMTQDPFSYRSELYNYENVPTPLRPLQQPHPPIWYASSNTTGACWAGEQGLHFCSNGPVERAKENIDAFRSGLAKRDGPLIAKPEFDGGTAIGVLRHIVVAETDAEARDIAEREIANHARSLNWIRKRQGPTAHTNRLDIHRDENFAAWEASGMAIAGTPDKIVAALKEQIGILGINYLVSYLFFGNMTRDQAMRSLNLFCTDVMPDIAKL